MTANNGRPKEVTIYARVSDDSQRDNNSIPAQLHACLQRIEQEQYILKGDRFVDKYTGYDVPEGTPNSIQAYVDDESGFTDERPMLHAMLEFIEREKVDLVLCWHFDRMARELDTFHIIDIRLEAAGATVEFINGPNFDRNSDTSKLMRHLFFGIAEYEIAHRNARMREAKNRLAREGRHPNGRAPFGYKLDPLSQGGLAIDDEKASIVKGMFMDYLFGGKTLYQIACQLNEVGIPPSLRGRWHAATVARMLRNTTYMGTRYWGMSTRKKTDKTNVPLPYGLWQSYTVTPLISREMFERVQEMLEHNREIKHHQAQRVYLLAGMIFCKECGKVYCGHVAGAGSSGRITDDIRYVHKRKHHGCAYYSVKAAVIEDQVWQEVRNLLRNPDRLESAYAERQNGTRYHEQIRKIALIKTQIDRLTAKLDNLLEVRLEGSISRAIFEAKQSDLKKQLAAAERKCREEEEKLSEGPTPEKIKGIKEFTKRIEARLLYGDPTAIQKRQLYQMMHLRVERGKDGKIELSSWFRLPEDENSTVGLEYRSRL